MGGSSNSILDSALDVARRGWPCFPVCVRQMPDGKRTKRPLVKDWRNAASLDPDELRRMFSMSAANGIGVPMGARSGLWLLDEDVPGALDGLPLVDTLEARTPRPGRHFFFRYDAGTAPGNGNPLPGVDVKSEGGFAVMAPTEGYAWTNDCEPADAPEELLLALASEPKRTAEPRSTCMAGDGDTPYGLAALSDECETLRTTPEGGRNTQLNRSAFCIGQLIATGCLTEATARRELTSAAEDAGLDAAEIAATLSSGLAAGAEHPRGPSSGPAAKPMRTDFGNVERIVRHVGEDVRFCPSLGWLVWSGRVWERDELGRATEKAKAALRYILEDAKSVEDDTERAALASWGAKSQSASRLMAALKLAETHPGIAVRHAALDRNPWLITCRNGTLDLRTQVLRTHDREDLITKLANVVWEPDARAPLFERFLERVLPDPEVREFIQKWFGYALTGESDEQCLAFLYGTGQNGKSVLVAVMQRVFGEYAKSAPITTFIKRRPDAATNDIAGLAGARLVVASETDEGVRLSEAMIKQLTGQDRVAARHLYREFFEFDPTFKITISGNYKPQVQGTDEGIWRRIRLVPFVVHIPEHERDRGLLSKLRHEAAGIFAWAVRGCAAWRQSGLGTPQAIAEATQEYRSDEDVLGQFVHECLDVGPGKTAASSEVMARYKTWCTSSGQIASNQKVLGGYLSRRGFVRRKSSRYTWHGFSLRPEQPELVFGKETARDHPDHTDPSPGNSLTKDDMEKVTESGLYGLDGPTDAGGQSFPECDRCLGTDFWVRRGDGGELCRACFPPAPGEELEP